MLMIDPRNLVTRGDLSNLDLPVPASTRSWKTVPHHVLANSLVRHVEDRGLRIRSEKWALMDGALYPTKGIRVEIRGARLFGNLDLEPIPGVQFPASPWVVRSLDDRRTRLHLAPPP